MINYEYRNCY